MHNDGTGPQYDHPARRGEVILVGVPLQEGDENLPPAIVENADGSPVEHDEDGVPIVREADTTAPVAANEPEVEATEPEAAPEPDEGFDPNEVTVATAKAYLAANPDQTDYVLDRERAGKARATLLNEES